MATATKKPAVKESVIITAPKIRSVKVKITGNAPYCQARFSEKAKAAMMAAMDGSQKKGTKKAREARDYDADYEGAKHISTENWVGIPCSSLRAALISACRLTGFTMTRAKLSVFVPAEAFDKVDGQGLFRIYGKSERYDAAVRNANGSFDIRVRPLWREWSAEPIITFDEDQFSLEDVLNLLRRVGLQIGLGEGRPDSRQSAGLGFGTFTVSEPDEVKEAE